MRFVAQTAIALALVGCSKGTTDPVDFKNLSMIEASRQMFAHGALKDGLWSIQLKVDSVSIDTLPSDGTDARMIMSAISQRATMQPAREAKACLSVANIGHVNLPGFSDSCVFPTLHLGDDSGSSTMVCQKSKSLQAAKASAQYKFSEGSFEQSTKLDTFTDLGGAGKLRPEVATMHATFQYVGPCPSSESGKT